MKFLLTALAGLSFAGGTAAPLISQSTTNHQNVGVQTSTTISLDGDIWLETNQGEGTWWVEFDWYGPNQIRHVNFEDEALKAYAEWGNDSWTRKVETIEVISVGTSQAVFSDEHNDFLARQRTALHSNITYMGEHKYRLTLTYLTKSYNSFTGSWGRLTGGDSITFTD